MGILRKFREWREDKDGTLIGPNIEADSVNTGSATIDNSRVYIQDTEPTDAEDGDVWIDTS